MAEATSLMIAVTLAFVRYMPAFPSSGSNSTSNTAAPAAATTTTTTTKVKE